MGIKFGNSDIKEIYVYQEEEINPLCFTANTAGSTVTLGKTGSPSIANTAYSRDGVNWISYTPGSTGAITLTNVGDIVFFRNNITGNFGTAAHLRFTMTGSISASGNCNSMYSAEGFEDLTKLSYTYCYYNMFSGCTSLTTAPELPAIALSSSCYNYMFSGCTNLTTAPEIPAISLSSSCCDSMFYGCSNLIELPKLYDRSLEPYCYRYMFYGCSKIKISTTQTGAYQTAYRIPTSGTGTEDTQALNYMFANTGGTFTGTPSINTTYYTSNEVV